ncbi:MAG: hypothetical protein AAFW46_08200 [Pseudomonadota bacterium]
MALSAAAALFAGGALAQPYDCAKPEESCAQEVAPICLQRTGAGSIAAGGAGSQASDNPACRVQMSRYSQCLSWIAQNCDTGPAEGAGGATAGAPSAVNQTTVNRTTVQGDLIQGDKVDTKIEQNIQILTPGATPENPSSAVRQHCFIWDNKKMCEPY